MIRRAIVSGARDRAEVEAYLPDNYRVVEERRSELVRGHADWIVEGEDRAGWTLDGYVIPRLASGMIAAREIA